MIGLEVAANQLRSPEYFTVITLLPLGNTTGNVKTELPPFPRVRNCGVLMACEADPFTESKNCTVPLGLAAGFCEMMGSSGAPTTEAVKLVCVLAATTLDAGFNVSVGIPGLTSVVMIELL